MMWPLAVVVAAAIVLTVVLVLGPRLFAGNRLTHCRFRCPFRQRDVSAEFVENVWSGRRMDVTRCSVFVPPTAVDCQKGCLRLSHLLS